jgi:ribosomal-protein-alanine N-acetyltransferase
VSESPFADALAGELALRTPRFELKPVAPADAEAFHAHLSDPAVVEFMDTDPHTDIAQTLAVIEWSHALRAAGAGVRWAIREERGGDFVGSCGFNTLVGERGRRGEVAYDVSQRFWGRRVMDEVLPEVLAFGFGVLGLRRIEAMVTAGNEPSCRLLERHGFEREGALRDHAYWKGRYWDQLVYGRLGQVMD